MKKEVINRLVDNLPAESELYIEPGRRFLSMTPNELRIHRRSKAYMDPRFPWAYVMDHIRRDAFLPVHATDRAMRDAYAFQTGITENEAMTEALILMQPDMDNFRGCIEACLLVPELTLEEISEKTQVSVKALKYFEALLFSVRDRLDDTAFYGFLHLPGTLSVLESEDYWRNAGPARIMKHAAATFRGGATSALTIYGKHEETNEMTSQQLVETFKKKTLKTALLSTEMGGHYRARNPLLSTIKGMLIAQEQNPNAGAVKDSSDDLAGLSALVLTPGDAIMITANGCRDNSDYIAMLESAGRSASLAEAISKQPPEPPPAS